MRGAASTVIPGGAAPASIRTAMLLTALGAAIAVAPGCSRPASDAPAPAASGVPASPAAAVAPAPPANTAAPAARLESLFSDLHARGLFDGAVVVRGRGGFVFERGYGFADLDRRLPFTPETPSDGASLAKTFTAALLVGLHEEKRLDLDAPARRLLPELPYPGVTLRHLLSHTSGIPVLDYDYFDPYLSRGEPRTTARLLQVLAARTPPRATPPGTAFEYSSLGFDLAALAAERATGTTYAALLDERFFRPLGMTSAFVRPASFSDFPGVRTRAYRRVGGRLEPNDVFDGEGFHGGSNIYFSARDLGRWNAAFLPASAGLAAGLGAGDVTAEANPAGSGADDSEAPAPAVYGETGSGEAGVGRAVFSPAVLGELLRPARVDVAPSGLTLGSWYHGAGGSAHWYSGHLQGFHSEVFRDRSEGWSVVYVSNNTLEPWLQNGIVRAVIAALADGKSAATGVTAPGLAAPGLTAPATAEISAGARGILAGRWSLRPGEFLDIEHADGRLDMWREHVRYRIVPIGPRWFYVPGLDFILGLARGGDGSLPRLYVASNLAESWCEREESAKKKPQK